MQKLILTVFLVMFVFSGLAWGEDQGLTNSGAQGGVITEGTQPSSCSNRCKTHMDSCSSFCTDSENEEDQKSCKTECRAVFVMKAGFCQKSCELDNDFLEKCEYEGEAPYKNEDDCNENCEYQNAT